MRRPAVLLSILALILAACGDGGSADDGPDARPDGPPPDERCEPPPPTLPTGPQTDPNAVVLDGCVAGGLRTLPGRWFVNAPGSGFQYEYPKFEGDCTQGFRRANIGDEDHDITPDGFTFHQWSDGTRVFTREYYRFPPEGDPEFEYVNGFVACMNASGELVAAALSYDTDLGPSSVPMVGRRFDLKDGPATGLTLQGELGVRTDGFPLIAYNVVVDGTIAYVAGPYGLDTIDVSDPTQPEHLGHVDGDFNDVKVVRGNGAVVAFAAPLYSERTAVVDVTRPAEPMIVAQLNEYSHSVQTATRGTTKLLYLANYTEAVPVFNVTNPLNPIRLGQAMIPGAVSGVHDLYPDGDMLFLNYTTEGFVALDISGGIDAPVERGRVPTSYSHASWAGDVAGRRIAIHGDEGMTPSDGGAFLRVFDADPASPTFMDVIGQYQSRPEVGIHNIQLVGDKAYVAYYHDGVRVLDLSDPAQPTEIAHFNTWNVDTAPGGAFEAAIGVRVVNGTIYVADTLRGLLILSEP